MLYSSSLIAVVSRRKASVLKHKGVLVPDGRIAHCAPGRGVHLSTAEEFAAGEDVDIERVVPLTDHADTLARIAVALQQRQEYDIINNNCETFANRVTGQKAESRQLQTAVALMLLGLLCLAAARS